MSVSTEDIKRIVNNFLLNAPPGEFHEVVTDVRGLLQNDGLLNELAPTSFREYNTEQMLVVNSPNQPHKAIISKFGEVGPNEYLDPQGAQVLTFDHFKQEVVSARPAENEIDAELEPWRSAVQKELLDYINGFYDFGSGAVFASKDGKEVAVTVAISSALFNAQNFYNGRWRSVWTAKFTPGKQATITGMVRINVHYYEDGNVQLNTNTSKKASCPALKPDSFAEAFKKVITEQEGEFQTLLESNYEKMNGTTFKALRRQLPITATKVNWAKIGHYKIGSEIKQ